MADFAGCVAGSAHNLSIDDEPAADTGAEGEKDEMPQVTAIPAHAKVELRQRSSVSVVFDKDRNAGKCLHQPRFQGHMMPARQVRRVEQEAFVYFERAADGDADGGNGAAFTDGVVDDGTGVREERGKGLCEGLGGAGFKFAALEDTGIGRALNTSGLGAADVEAEDGARCGLHFLHRCACALPLTNFLGIRPNSIIEIKSAGLNCVRKTRQASPDAA